MRKGFVLLIVAALMFTSMSFVFAEGGIFKDVSELNWARENIEMLANRGVFNGYEDGTFRPQNKVTVAEFIKIVDVALGDDPGNAKDGKWYLTYIEKSKDLGLVEDGEFTDFNRNITRAEMARVIVRALNEEYPENLDDYIALIHDYSTIPSEFQDHIVKAYSKGILTGNPDGNFYPNNDATRGEAATILARLLDRNQRKLVLLPNIDDVFNQPDLVKLTNINSGYRVEGTNMVLIDYYDSNNQVVLNPPDNPNLNTQLYNATKALITNDHYVYVDYYSSNGIVFLQLIKGKVETYAANRPYFFEYIFYDEAQDVSYSWENEKASKNAVILLEISRLYWQAESFEDIAQPLYREKLKGTLIGIFGNETGSKIYDYIISIYIDFYNTTRSGKVVMTQKTIDNVQIDYGNSGRSNLLSFYFTFK